MDARQLALPGPIGNTRCTIRRFEAGDIPAFASFLGDEPSVRYLPFPAELRSAEGASLLVEQTMSRYESDAPSLAYAVVEPRTQAFLGFCGLNPLSPDEVELMYGVVRSEWGRGIGSAVASALCRHVERAAPGARCVGFVHPDNGPSLAILARLGFRSHGLVRHEMFDSPVLKLVRNGVG